LSFLASGTIQAAADPDNDGWGDQARARRWGIRPRFTSTDAKGRSLFVTAGYGYDSRRGGTIDGTSSPVGGPFLEELTGRRADVGMALKIPRRDSGNVAVRLALSTNGRQRRFGAG